ncbi:MAG: signal peptidase I [Clostridia bacterium]|nr:signal peptidase I [Clostridia bacterium]
MLCEHAAGGVALKITEYNIYYELPPKPGENKKEEKAQSGFDWMQSIVLAITVLFFVFTFFIRPVEVVGDSMLPTLQDGNWLLISAFDRSPKQGDIVIITQPVETESGEPIVKRVIALGGQTVDIDFQKGVVTVDGKALDEPYVKELTKRKLDVSFPLTVPEGTIFVMGDNRNRSLDSRSNRIGFIDDRYVLGHVLLRVKPFGNPQYVNYSQEE